MALIFGMPSGITDDMEMVLAAIQTWAGRLDAFGRWTDATLRGGDFLIDGAGNSWVVPGSGAGSKTSQVSYMVYGNAMLVNLDLRSTTLTVATSQNALFVRIPDGYQVAGTPATLTAGARVHTGYALILDAGATSAGTIYATPAYKDRLQIQKSTAANFGAGTCAVQGQVWFEIEPRT